jgi:hypothetical protein
VGLVQHSRDVRDLFALVQGGVALNVASHAVDEMGDGFAGVGVVGMVVDN